MWPFALARIGVGHLHLIDFDRVDLTNLNRQQYFIRHLGMYKTEALREEILEINPYLDIRTDCIRVTEENLKGLFEEDTIICEAFDVPENKAMLVNGVLECFPEKRLVSASGMAGFDEQQSDTYPQSDAEFLSVRRRSIRAGIWPGPDGAAGGCLRRASGESDCPA